MKTNSLIQYQIFILIFFLNISSCCKKYDNNNINQNNLDYNQISIKEKYFPDSKKVYKKIKELQNINIIYFDFNQYNILPQFTQILNKHADFLYKHPNQEIIIEGHTDERGTPEYNIALGERRANSVKTYLQNQGVLENQISILSYGKEKPAFLGHSEKEYSKNRRALLIYSM